MSIDSRCFLSTVNTGAAAFVELESGRWAPPLMGASSYIHSLRREEIFRVRGLEMQDDEGGVCQSGIRAGS